MIPNVSPDRERAPREKDTSEDEERAKLPEQSASVPVGGCRQQFHIH
jgi:hypothetical protein